MAQQKEQCRQELQKQPSITDHYKHVEPTDWVVLYSDERFRQAALEWLIETDQVY